MKSEDYNRVSAEMCGADLEGWNPESNKEQQNIIQDILNERGYGCIVKKMEVEGEVLLADVYFINKKRDQLFPGSGYTVEEAFKNAFIDYCENFLEL